VSGISVSGAGSGTYYRDQAVPNQAAAREEQETLAEALRKEQDSQPTLVEMMRQAREKAAEREEMFQLPKNSRSCGEAVMMAYSKLARARSLGEVDAASGYARRQMAQLRAAKRSDPDNAQRIQAAINQLQKAVNRAGRKKREISQEKLTAKRQAKLEKEKRAREAKRLRHQLRSRQAMRMVRESGYLREADIDNRLQDQLAATRQELCSQMQQLQAQTPAEAAAMQYAAASSEPAPAPELNVEA